MASVKKRVRNGHVEWRARYRTASGAERSKAFKRKVDAERFLTTIEASQLNGTYIDPSLAKISVGEWTDRWLEGLAHIKPSTRSRYEGIVRKHVQPVWGLVRLENVTHSDVQAWVTSLSRALSPSSVRKVHRVLSLVLDSAVRDGRLARNVATGVNLPRPSKPEHRYLSHEQVDQLAEEMHRPSTISKHAPMSERVNPTNRLVVYFLAYTGVRWGEMAALRVGRLDLDRRRAAIVESVTPVHGKGLVWGTPKTHQRREVPIARFLIPELEAHIKGKAPDDFVFSGSRGAPVMRVSAFRASFEAAARAIGVPGLHPHELRHTAASLAIAAGADPKVIQKMLGHASASMTMDTYSHLFEDRLDEVSDAMDKARKPRPPA